MIDLTQVEGFEWDEGNELKNWTKHKVKSEEAEEIFINTPIVFSIDHTHSKSEKRFRALGKTNAGRKLFTVFVIRKSYIRIISIRDMNKKEKKVYQQYEQETKKNTTV